VSSQLQPEVEKEVRDDYAEIATGANCPGYDAEDQTHRLAVTGRGRQGVTLVGLSCRGEEEPWLGGRMRGTFGETIERLILLQIGAAAATRDKIEAVVEGLIAQGRIERAEGRTVVNEVLDRARERSGGARALVDASVQQGLRGAGVPNREAYEDLVFRVEQLEHRVRLLEGGSAESTPRPRTTDDAAGGEPTPPTPPTSGVDATPQSPRDEPEIPPGVPPER
jgi:polyhydroxyalkanoate synthesis regulator phasin